MKTIKIQLEKTTRTDLICIACGGFGVGMLAIMPIVGEPQAGVHHRCFANVHIKRAAPPRLASDDTAEEDTETLGSLNDRIRTGD